jgi:hypothetical protein
LLIRAALNAYPVIPCRSWKIPGIFRGKNQKETTDTIGSVCYFNLFPAETGFVVIKKRFDADLKSLTFMVRKKENLLRDHSGQS